MYKSWTFMLSHYKVKVVNSWFTGLKLFIDDELKDQSRYFLSVGNMPLLFTQLPDESVLEVCPKSTVFSTEIDVYLVEKSSEEGFNQTRKIFSSHHQLSLKEQRLIKELS